MASSTTNLSGQSGILFSGLAAVFRFILSGFDAVSAANTRAAAVERLSAKSDEELAALGIDRKDIVLHVFRDAVS